ncbi:hypothetical protein Msi02_21190 [Microbispora siamensis]|uniref:Uncharacterized protein n=1 Tax=Microbispora siamensis TaxID=564413 RepID=A0ABQ4GIN6_9ACTN|nr:hypothetical protein Msi02_21190 [Microbispora siamensis]
MRGDRADEWRWPPVRRVARTGGHRLLEGKGQQVEPAWVGGPADLTA